MDKPTIIIIIAIILALAFLIFIALNPAIVSAQINAELIEKAKEDKEEYQQRAENELEWFEGIEEQAKDLYNKK